jgi:hypothetical protein
MNANFAFDPIMPQEQFQIELNFAKGSFGNITAVPPEGIEVVGDDIQEVIDNKAMFTFKGQGGDYLEDKAIEFRYSDKKAFKEVIITSDSGYTEKVKTKEIQSPLKNIEMDYNKKVILPFLNWGWLGTYIIFSIVFSMLLRKWLKVY